MKVLKFLSGYVKIQIETTFHKIRVMLNIIKIINKLNPPDKWKLYWRGVKHDLSKYGWFESSGVAMYIFDLKHTTYGSEQYEKMLEDIRPSINAHYKKNSHHPEHYKNGMKDMSELDKLELIADWVAATKRHADGDIFRSIKINQKRFGYSDEDKEWLIKVANILS